MLDKFMWTIIDENVNMSVPWYLISNFAYHHLDRSVISDDAYDCLAKRLFEKWHQINHRHKELIDRQDILVAGYAIRQESLPLIVKGATGNLLQKLESLSR